MDEKRFWIVLTQKHLEELERFQTEESAQQVAQGAAGDTFEPVYVLEAQEAWSRVVSQPNRTYLYR